ncbi:MAG TPA: response regulator transcription factor [Thermoanaerobaculia bacterium]|nr:response regulator transcription factor [Thermoanaerobaculia bacterium]
MAEPTPLRVLIVEDDRRQRDSLRALIEGTPGYRCVEAVGSVEEALRWRGEVEPEVVLLDVHLPGVWGSQGVRRIREHFPAAAPVMLTVFEDDDLVFESLCNGAVGYILKKMPPTRLLESIKEARTGGSPMSPEIARKVVERLQRGGALPAAAALTAQEKRVLELLARGRSYQAAATEMAITINTVRNYIRNIYEKLEVHGRAEAVSKGLRTGLV